MRRASILLIAVLATPLSAQDMVDYAKQIKPLLKERCFTCHGALRQKGKLRLDTVKMMHQSGVIVPGKDAESALIERITAKDEKQRMPPPSESDALTAKQIDLLRQWIRQGAKGIADEKPEADPREHWAFRKPVRPQIPIVKNKAWVRNPIDAFIAARGAARVPGRQVTRRLREGRRSLARQSALWRTLGPALDGCLALQRLVWPAVRAGRVEQRAADLALA